MAYDEDLAARVRALLADVSPVTERRMFGSQAFLVSGNLAVTASQDGILVRVASDQVPELLATTAARQAQMGERVMVGWVAVEADAFDDTDLAAWVERGASYAASLPPK